jgi:Flp pilus assembly protein TadG
VEFAVIAPLLFTVLFGIIEYGYVFLVQQSLTNAAREGCRLAVLQTTGEPYTQVNTRIAEIMDAAGVNGYSVSMSHATQANPVESITVSVPYNNVSLTGFFGYKSYKEGGFFMGPIMARPRERGSWGVFGVEES